MQVTLVLSIIELQRSFWMHKSH